MAKHVSRLFLGQLKLHFPIYYNVNVRNVSPQLSGFYLFFWDLNIYIIYIGREIHKLCSVYEFILLKIRYLYVLRKLMWQQLITYKFCVNSSYHFKFLLVVPNFITNISYIMLK